LEIVNSRLYKKFTTVWNVCCEKMDIG
jgi:hypothetical protein